MPGFQPNVTHHRQAFAFPGQNPARTHNYVQPPLVSVAVNGAQQCVSGRVEPCRVAKSVASTQHLLLGHSEHVVDALPGCSKLVASHRCSPTDESLRLARSTLQDAHVAYREGESRASE
jgi:hypothetical protein